MAFPKMLPDQTAGTTIALLRAAVKFFAHHGIRTLLPDNSYSDPPATSDSPASRCSSNTAAPDPPPKTNGKAERFLQTALREWAYVKHCTDSEQRDQDLQH